MAGNNLVNKAGGIIAGRDVNLTAINDDVINERTVTTHESASDSRSERRGFVDSAARIEAANYLTIRAGRDINSGGGVLKSGADTTISAGRDVHFGSAEQVDSNEAGPNHRNQTITQYRSSIDVGRDLKVDAGRDISAIASQIDAKRNIAMSAENLTLASAADEQHSYSKSKEVKSQEDHVHQVSTTLTAGGNVALSAGKDLTLTSSRINAGAEAYLVAGNNLQLLAAQDSDYSLYDMKKRGSWGSKKTQHDEVTQVTNVGSEIKTGGDLTLASGGDQKYQVAKLESGKDLTLQSGGAITFEGVKDLHQESHEKSSSDLAWNSAEGKGNTDEALRQSQLLAKGNLVIKAVDGLHIDVKQINQNTVSQTIDAMVKADPQLAWLKDAEKRGDVDWRQIKEVHDSFKYDHSGLGQGAMLAIIIIVTVLTAGAASTAVASASTAMGATAGGTMAAATTATAATAATATTAATAATVATSAGLGNIIATASLTSLASTGVVSTINNKGNLGAAFKETFSSDSMKQALIAGASAGFVNYASGNWFGAQSDPITNKVSGPSVVPHWNDPAAIGRFGTIQLAGGAVRGTLSEALGQGSFKDAMKGSAFDVLQATAFTGVGDFGDAFKPTLQDSGLSKTALHAVVGGLLSEAMGGDFKTGAIAAGANEALITTLDKTPLLSSDDPAEHDRLVNAASKLVGLLAAASVDGDVSRGSEIAGNAQSYNRKLHVQEEKRLALEAKNLDASTGKSQSGFEWNALLTFVAGGEVDKQTNNELQGILSGYSPNNPEGQHLADDLRVARGVVTQLQNEKVLLTWSDGSPIVANGDKVVAFTSTDRQYNDSRLFNPSSNSTYNNAPGGMGVVPDKWAEQYGDSIAIRKLPEIGALSANAEAQAEQMDRLRVLAGGGINSNIDLKLLVELMPIGGVGKGTLLSAIKGLAARDALAVKGVEAVAGKGAEAFAGKGIESAGANGAGEVAGAGTFAQTTASTAQRPALPSGYREGSSGGAAFNETGELPEGYRRVSNTKTGNTEVVGSDGVFYYENAEGGLRPKAGGNLAELVAAEARISGAKGTGTAGEIAGAGASQKLPEGRLVPDPLQVPDVPNAPGMDRPFRPINPDFPPDKSVVDAMSGERIQGMIKCDSTDCSDIASKLFDAAGGKGKIIEVRPSKTGDLNVFENGATEPGQFYHQIYTDGRYVYDPRLSSAPIPKGDWEQHIKGINPDGISISDKLKGL
nr:DUF637 domain-containing protein [Pseudomonas sp. H3(2019)]